MSVDVPKASPEDLQRSIVWFRLSQAEDLFNLKRNTIKNYQREGLIYRCKIGGSTYCGLPFTIYMAFVNRAISSFRENKERIEITENSVHFFTESEWGKLKLKSKDNVPNFLVASRVPQKDGEDFVSMTHTAFLNLYRVDLGLNRYPEQTVPEMGLKEAMIQYRIFAGREFPKPIEEPVETPNTFVKINEATASQVLDFLTRVQLEARHRTLRKVAQELADALNQGIEYA